MLGSKSSVQYRFAHETDESFKVLRFDADRITIADLKILIAKATGLQKEFARTFDLKISILTDDKGTTEPATSDRQFVQPGSRLVVQRSAWLHHPSIQHTAQVIPGELSSPLRGGGAQAAEAFGDSASLTSPSGTKIAKAKKPFPAEFLCPLCHNAMSNAAVVRCSSKCGKSACRACIEKHLVDNKRLCPFCQTRVLSIIANKALASLIAQLDLDDYEMSTENTAVPPPPPTEIKAEEQAEPPPPPPPAAPIQSPIDSPTALPLAPPLKEAVDETSVPMIDVPSLESKIEVDPKIETTQSLPTAALMNNPLLKSLSTMLNKATTKSEILLSAPPQPTLQPPSPFPASGPPSVYSDSNLTSASRPMKSGLDRKVKGGGSLSSMNNNNMNQINVNSKVGGSGVSSSQGGDRHYEFDPLTNSWKRRAPVAGAPSSLKSDQHDKQMSPGASSECPFKSADELVALFPLLSKKDFTMIREFQRQLKEYIDKR